MLETSNAKWLILKCTEYLQFNMFTNVLSRAAHTSKMLLLLLLLCSSASALMCSLSAKALGVGLHTQIILHQLK